MASSHQSRALVGRSAGSEESGPSSSSLPLGSNPRSPICFPFSSAYPPLFGLSDCLNPCLGESLHLTKSTENGCPYSVIPASRPREGDPVHIIPLLSIVCLYLEAGLSWQGQRLPISGQTKSGWPSVTSTRHCESEPATDCAGRCRCRPLAKSLPWAALAVFAGWETAQ